MNPFDLRIVARPRGTFEVADLAVALVRTTASQVLRLSVLALVPAWLLLSGLAIALLDAPWQPALAVVPVLLSPLLQVPFTVLFSRLLFDEQVRVAEVARGVRRGSGAWLGGQVLRAAAWALVLFTFGMGAPVALPIVTYVGEVGLLERQGMSATLQRSIRLASGYPAHALFAETVRWVVPVWFALLFEALGELITVYVLQLGQPFGSLATGVVTPWLLLGLFAAQPAIALVRLLLYVDTRTRLEGWDLQVAFRALALERR